MVKMFEDLEIEICCFSPLLSSTFQLPGEGVGGGWGLPAFSFSYIFIYFSHRVSRCNIMFIHGELSIIDTQMEPS